MEALVEQFHCLVHQSLMLAAEVVAADLLVVLLDRVVLVAVVLVLLTIVLLLVQPELQILAVVVEVVQSMILQTVAQAAPVSLRFVTSSPAHLT